MSNRSDHPLFVVSGGYGASGEQVARTALAQFEDPSVSVKVVPHVKTRAQIEEVVSEAAVQRGTILHTLVDVRMREILTSLAREKNVIAIDLMGRLLSRLATVLEEEPLGQPGLYRQLQKAYFERVESIEFAVAHDDGQRTENLDEAEIVLVGPSRVGKTPLSMYLSVQGWKVANVALVEGIDPPSTLFQVASGKVVGLTIEPGQLISHREGRQSKLGGQRKSAYTEATSVFDEVEWAERLYRSNSFAIVDVTDKPIEESADEVITLVRRRTDPHDYR